MTDIETVREDWEQAKRDYRQQRRARAKGRKTDRLIATGYAVRRTLLALMRAEVEERDSNPSFPSNKIEASGMQ